MYYPTWQNCRFWDLIVVTVRLEIDPCFNKIHPAMTVQVAGADALMRG
jgi:hypothetical protein